MNQEDVTYQDKMGELRLDISHPNSHGINFIFVEGDSDIKLFRKLFSLEKCKVERIPGGNAKLEECVSSLVERHTLIIGIRDADFIHLSSLVYTKTNMFLTDYHDIEMTMLSQEIVLNSLMFEFTRQPKDQYTNFKNDILKTIEKIGYLKWLNERMNLEYRFSSVGFQDLVSFENDKIDFKQYLKRVIAKSKSSRLTNISKINYNIDELYDKNPDLMQLTNGHDLLNTFAKYFREKTNNKGLSDENIASSLRMTFNIESFQNTQLYASLIEWSSQENTELF
jgi:hypothetical protein